jgi:hypothetical protein
MAQATNLREAFSAPGVIIPGIVGAGVALSVGALLPEAYDRIEAAITCDTPPAAATELACQPEALNRGTEASIAAGLGAVISLLCIYSAVRSFAKSADGIRNAARLTASPFTPNRRKP